MNLMQREVEVGWAAGIFEGEGCITMHDVSRGKMGSWQVFVTMTDRDVIERLALVLGGSAQGPYKPPHYKDHYKPFWRWQVQDRRKINDVLTLLYPHLGHRRREKCDEFFVWFSEWEAQRLSCPHCGVHRESTKRPCKDCTNRLARERRAKRASPGPLG